jgi:hypothetical protein
MQAGLRIPIEVPETCSDSPRLNSCRPQVAQHHAKATTRSVISPSQGCQAHSGSAFTVGRSPCAPANGDGRRRCDEDQVALANYVQDISPGKGYLPTYVVNKGIAVGGPLLKESTA